MALRTNLELNVTGKNDAYGKRVHRDLAIKLGIPADIAYRKKETAQHGSGIHYALDVIARNNGYDPSTVPEYYLKELMSREKIGSSKGTDTITVIFPCGQYLHTFSSIWTTLGIRVDRQLRSVDPKLPIIID